jgi:hypothetical protein
MNLRIPRRTIAGILMALATAACATLRPPDNPPASDPLGPGGEPNATPVRGALPRELQTLREQGLTLRGEHVVFDGELSFPPRLKGQPTVSTVHLEITPGPLPSMHESRQKNRAAALANSRVLAALGERFSLLGSGWLDPDKAKGPNAVSDRYQLTFYNYTRDEVVTVITSRQREVIDLQSTPARVQPAESREEVDAAIEIVRRDVRDDHLTRELRGRGILTESPDNDRYLYLLFYRAPRTPAVFEATVNMSTGKVVSARPLH